MRGLALQRYHLYFNEGGHVIRTLRFIIDDNVVIKDPDCDFSGMFPGKEDSVRLEFSFSNDWDNTVKVVGFYSLMGKEYEPQVLVDDACMIPAEVLERTAFMFRVYGKRGKYRLKSDERVIRQSGGKK